MRYCLMINTDEKKEANMSEAEMGKLMGGYMAFGEEAGGAGVLTGGERLKPTHTATQVRVRDGEVMTTDGPYAETKEQFGGFYIVDVENIDEAIRWASKIPGAHDGCVEVRPIWEMEEA